MPILSTPLPQAQFPSLAVTRLGKRTHRYRPGILSRVALVLGTVLPGLRLRTWLIGCLEGILMGRITAYASTAMA
jgi:hypothetical protein